jgi:lysylphosphatidylglycerol synthetase-like protein (DUF2156 family)
VTQDARTRLHVVTGNHVVPGNHVAIDGGTPADGSPLADLVRRAAELDARVAAESAPRVTRTGGLVAAGVALTVVLALLGRQTWQLPGRSAGGVTDVPQSLLTFLLLCAALCVWCAGRLVRPAETLRPAAAQLWWALVAGSALVTVAAALSLASFAGTGQRPGDLLLRCAVPLVPAVLAGVLAAGAGRTARVRAALGTGLVTVPMGAVGWALLSSTGRSSADLGDVLAMTALAGAAPLAVAVAFVAADRRARR